MYYILSYIVYIYCFLGVDIYVLSFPTQAVLFQIYILNLIVYCLYIFHLNCSPNVNIFIVSVPTQAVLFQIAPRRNTKGQKNIEKILLELNSWVERPYLEAISQNEVKRKHEESSWIFFISWDHTLVHRYSKEREEKCNYTTPTAHWNHKFIQETT